MWNLLLEESRELFFNEREKGNGKKPQNDEREREGKWMSERQWHDKRGKIDVIPWLDFYVLLLVISINQHTTNDTVETKKGLL